MKKRMIQRVVKYVMDRKKKEIQFFHREKGLTTTCFWFSLVATCLLICVYQISSRVRYYLSEPTVVDVFNEVVSRGDMPMLTLCSQHTEAMEKLNMTSMRVFMPANISSEEYWKLINTATTIEEVYYSQKDNTRVKASVKNVATIFGSCSQIFNDEPLSMDYSYPRLHVVFNKKLGRLDQYLDTKDTKYLDLATWLMGDVLKSREIRVAVGKYLFLQRKASGCLSSDEYNECQNKCAQKYYAKLLPYCRFPFMEKRDGDLFCSMSGQYYKTFMTNIYQEFFNTSVNKLHKCSCQRKCLQTLYSTQEDLLDDFKTEIQLYFKDNICRTMIERWAFDFTSLLCDIGGNVGLFLGISLLSFTDYVMKFGNFLVHKRRVSKFASDLMFRKVTKIFNIYQKVERKTKYKFQRPDALQMFTYIVELLALCIFMFQSYDRILHYLAYPVLTTIELKQITRYSMMVSSVSCVGSKELHIQMDEFSQRFNVSRDNIDIVDLLKMPTNFSNAEELWLLSSDFQEHSKHALALLTGNLTSTLTPFGNCTKTEQDGAMFKIDRSNCKFLNFMITPDETYNLKKYLVLYCTYMYFIRYQRQMIIRPNSPVNPCSSRVEFTQCVEKCYMSKLLTNNIACSLPFTNLSHLPTCKTWPEAKFTKRAYLEAYMNTNPIEECNCNIQCEEKIYFFTETKHSKFIIPNMTAIQYMQDNNNWEVIKQELSFPIIKLLCDIGSNMGIIIGCSLLSIFEFLMQSMMFLKENFIRRKKSA